MLKKFAEELKEARLSQHITLKQIAVKTRIDIKILENLEEGNFDALPEDVYRKAFIKEYSRALGLDENAMIKKYEMARSGKQFEEKTFKEEKEVPAVQDIPKKVQPEMQPVRHTHVVDEVEPYEEESGEPKFKKSSLILSILVGVLVIASVVAYFIVFRSPSTEIVNEKPYDEVVKENQQTEHAPGPDTTRQNKPAVRPDSLTLIVKTKDDSWMRIKKDGVKSEEFTLLANTEKIVKAKKGFNMTVGNANSIELVLNSTPLQFKTKKGRLSGIIIDSAGVKVVAPRPVAKEADSEQ
jgi:cytoskeletal protein RodZ